MAVRKKEMHQLYAAEVNYRLPFEQVSDELIEDFQIHSGNYDAETDPAQGILDVFSSFIYEEFK